MTSSTNQEKRKIFSIEEANRTLPLVSRVVNDIVQAQKDVERLHAEATEAAAAGQVEVAESHQDEIQKLTQSCEEYAAELELIGCELKDPQAGLIDFPARLDDRVVLLCWKLGEEKITHWHELFAGFAGRQAIDEAEFLS